MNIDVRYPQTNLDEEKYAEVTVNLDGCEPVTFNIRSRSGTRTRSTCEIDG
jgi:hypothetical protein